MSSALNHRKRKTEIAQTHASVTTGTEFMGDHPAHHFSSLSSTSPRQSKAVGPDCLHGPFKLQELIDADIMEGPTAGRPESRVCACPEGSQNTQFLITFTAISAISSFVNKEKIIHITEVMESAVSAQS